MSVPRGEPAFLEHYARALDARWPALLDALRQTPPRVLRENAFAAGDAPTVGELSPMPQLAGCFESGPPGSSLLEARGQRGLKRYYQMDAASVLAARALEVIPGERVMDMCAAPGGKALVLAEALRAEGELVLNDRSKSRLSRLKRVLDDYVPEEVRETIRLSCGDGKRFGRTKEERYDAILLDAPCSSERHVLGDRSELSKWSPGRVKRLSVEQFALLSSAFFALKPGGKLLYCTCALLPEENDAVVERLLERRAGAIELDHATAPLGEKTRSGWQIWPDRTGLGPIYFSRLRKLRSVAKAK